MRTIDADNLSRLKFVGNKFVQIGGRSNGKTLEAVNRAYQQGWNDAIDVIINDIPTIERPHGEWLEVKEEVHYDYITVCECSLCKHSWALGELSIEDVKDDYKFCPNCGADMRKETDND